jgi:hypothetical protein
MTSAFPAALIPAPVAPHLDFAALGPCFATLLGSLPLLSDAARDALPREWIDPPCLLATLIEDEGMTTEMAAHEASVPVHIVATYRLLTGI